MEKFRNRIKLPMVFDVETYELLRLAAVRLNVSMARVVRILVRRYAADMQVEVTHGPGIDGEKS